jgi:uroporphyrinogen-III synthase
MKSLVWTRPASDWQSDSQLLKAVGEKAHIERLPCVAVTPVKVEPLTGKFDVLVFTSSKAADFALVHHSVMMAAKQAKAVYTHGPSTAKTLARYDLRTEIIDVRTAEDLAAGLLAKLEPGTKVLWPRAKEPAFDLEGALNDGGLVATSFVCYRTDSGVLGLDGKPLAKGRLKALRESLTGVVCFASPSAVEGFVLDLEPRDHRLGREVIAIALGPTTAKACEGHFQTVKVAKANGLEALVARAVSSFGKSRS